MLVLPPSFPYGGMENPIFTFATPSIISKVCQWDHDDYYLVMYLLGIVFPYADEGHLRIGKMLMSLLTSWRIVGVVTWSLMLRGNISG